MKLDGLKLALLSLCALFHVGTLASYATNYTNVDVSRWQCLLCEFNNYFGATGQTSVTSILTTDDSDRFGRNGSFERAGTRSVLEANMGVNRSSGWVFNVLASNVGLDSNDFAFEVKNSGSLEAEIRFQKYRRLTESEALTPFHITNDRLTLDSDWQRNNQTHGFSSLATANRFVELATTRRLLESTVNLDITPRIEISIQHRSESKEGIDGAFRDGILQSVELPRTIDQESISNRVQISYRDRRLSAAWSRTDSTFENFEPVLQWESPYRFGPLENQSANASSHRHFSDTFDVCFSLPHNSQLRLHDRWGETKTTPRSLRYGFGDLIRDIEPVELFAEREYHSRRVLFSTELSRSIEVSISRLIYKINDFRPMEALTPALGGLFLLPLRSFRPGDFERRESEITVNYRTDTRMSVRSRIWENTRTRMHQEIRENQTQGIEINLTRALSSSWESFLTGRVESRAASEFQAVTTNNPHTRRFHQAHMTGRIWSGGVNYTSPPQHTFVSIVADLERQDYPYSALGFDQSENRGMTLSYGLRIGKRTSVDGYVASHKHFATINGSQSLDLSMPWLYSSNNSVHSAGLRLLIKPFSTYVDNVLFDYTLSDGQARLRTLFDGSTSFFPSQISRHESIDILVEFREIYGTRITARIYFEEYDAKDWSIDGIHQSTLSKILTLGSDYPPYSNTVFAIELGRGF